MECKVQSGCGDCPDLLRYHHPGGRNSRNLHANSVSIAEAISIWATPSQWLMDQVEKSVITTGVIDARVINNGIDTRLSNLHPKNKPV